MTDERYPHYISLHKGVPDSYPHRWAYSGACLSWQMAKSVSVGIYQVVPKSRGNGLKRWPVEKRIHGNKLDQIFEAAERWIAETEAQR